MSTNNTEQDVEQSTADQVTDFIAILEQHAKGSVQLEASRALADVVAGALDTEKKGYVSVKVEVEPMDSGTVRLKATVTKKVPEDPAASIWFADGEGQLSRDNAGLYYGNR